MEKRYWETLGKTLPLMGMGIMRMPCLEDGSIDCETAQSMVDYLYGQGVRYFDTAYFYHGGQSEIFIGEALSKYPREEYCLADKLPTWNAKEEADVQKIFEEQLRKTGKEYFDFYLFHAINGGGWERCKELHAPETLLTLKEQGKIRHLGFSFHGSKEDLAVILQEGIWDFVQLQLNYYDWEKDGRNLYEQAAAKNLPIIIMEPVRGGGLVSIPDSVADLFKEHDSSQTKATWAMRFAASLPQTAVVLSGVSSMAHCEENAAVFSPLKPMDEKELTISKKMVEAIDALALIPCTGCRYCIDCSETVNIPAIFDAYNNLMRFNNEGSFRWFMEHEIKEESRPDRCIGCGVCSSKCPQNIDIPAMLEVVAKRLKD